MYEHFTPPHIVADAPGAAHSPGVRNAISRLFGRCRRYRWIFISFIKLLWANAFCTPIIDIRYNGFWNYRASLISSGKDKSEIYKAYLERNSASIGLKSKFIEPPVLPHGLHGIHISDGAVFGLGVTIFQNVTIGSNTLLDTKCPGAPSIGNNVYIGANAVLVGGITIGDNCRIGAGCIVFSDVPPNSTVVAAGAMRIIQHKFPKDNSFRYL